MDIALFAQYAAFGLLALIAIAGALGMATTMSMFRSGIFLMASFIGVAGLFILLMADLLGLLQIMMYIGGMLVMILFMLLFSSDPGGAMMSTNMKLKAFEWFFSLGLSRAGDGPNESHDSGGDGAHGGHGGHGGHENGGGHGDMSMFTEVKAPAAVLATLVGLLFCALLLWRPAWRVVDELPNPNSPEQIGQLLMGKYMIAFEGAGMLILLGIFGAVFAARPGRHPGSRERSKIMAAADETPPPVPDDRPVALFDIEEKGGH